MFKGGGHVRAPEVEPPARRKPSEGPRTERYSSRAVRSPLRALWTSCALAQECQPRAAARRGGASLGGAEDCDPPLPLHSARGKQSAGTRDEVALDCSDWRCCGALACSEHAVSQRRVNFTVFVVLLLFAFIYWTVVFAAVRVCSRVPARVRRADVATGPSVA